MLSSTREKLYLLAIIILIALCAQFYYTYHYQPAHEIEVYYNQDTQLNKKIIATIQDADKYVYFAIYTFTRGDIEDALLAAKYRGLTVIGITDTSQYNSAAGQSKIIDALRDKGIPVYEQNTSGIMHMKAVVTDKAYASGSFNWTTSATTINDEVLETGSDPAVRGQYENILKELFAKYGSQ